MTANEEGSRLAVDIMRGDLQDIFEIEDPRGIDYTLAEMRRRLTSMCLTANGHLNDGTLRMLAEVNRI